MAYEPSKDKSVETSPRYQPDRERRATLRALKTWTTAQHEDEIPDLASLTGKPSLEEEQKVLTENQFLILFEPYTSNSVVIFYGSELPNMLEQRNLGNDLQQTLPSCLRDLFHEACREAVEKGDVVYRDGSIYTPSGADVLYRSIFMPLRSDNFSNRIYIFGSFSNQDGGTALLAAS